METIMSNSFIQSVSQSVGQSHGDNYEQFIQSVSQLVSLNYCHVHVHSPAVAAQPDSAGVVDDVTAEVQEVVARHWHLYSRHVGHEVVHQSSAYVAIDPVEGDHLVLVITVLGETQLSFVPQTELD